MANLSGFDANRVEPTAEFTPLPAGKYAAAIVGSEIKPTKSGQGQFLELKFQVLDGPHKDRTVFARLNLVNNNPVAVKMAQAELSAICRAVGVLTPNDSVELHNLPLVISVKCKKRSDNGEIANEIAGYAQKQVPATSAPSPNNSLPPWQRS